METSPLARMRQEKDAFFRTNPHSPLTPDQRTAFEGLSYFPYDPGLVLQVHLQETPDEPPVDIQTNTGDVQRYERFGRFRFVVGDQEAELTIYRNDHGYFLPFADALAGSETYGAGRYLEPEALPDGRIVVDFNLAYNPYCAYNENWSCPITPAENRIAVPIRAGERTFAADR